MFVKLAVIACSLTLAAAYSGPLAGGLPAAQFPAGVSPQACPNYPNCENPSVAVDQQPIGQYQQPQAQYQQQAQPQYQQQYQPQQQAQQYQPQQAQARQYAPDVQNALNRGEYIGDGDYHGEGLAEALAPGYQQPQAYQQQPQQYQQQPQQYQQQPQQYQQQPQAYQQQQQAYQPAYQQQAAHAQPAQVPAGVDARSCPNYPFCA